MFAQLGIKHIMMQYFTFLKSRTVEGCPGGGMVGKVWKLQSEDPAAPSQGLDLFVIFTLTPAALLLQDILLK